MRRLKVSFWILLTLTLLSIQAALADTPKDSHFIVLPYVAVGGVPGGWHFRTLLFLGNPNAQGDSSGSIEFFGDDGKPLPILLNNSTDLTAKSEWSAPPQHAVLLIVTHPSNDYQAGWFRVNLAEKSPLKVTVVIQLFNGDDLAGETGIKAASYQDEEDRDTLHFATVSQSGSPARWMMRPAAKAQLQPAVLNLSAGERLNQVALRATSSNASPASLRRSSGAQKRRTVQVGNASWYGGRFNGSQKADGTPFWADSLTAAHRTLPMGTKIRVVNLRNHRSVVVLISDRGPYAKNRIVDLSAAAARQLGMIASGVTRVRLEVLPS